MQLDKKELSWILYDFANSAFSIAIITALFPIYFNSITNYSHESSTMLSLANLFYALLLAILSPILGTISDYLGYKKRFLTIFFVLGLLATISLSIIPSQNYYFIIIVYIIACLGFTGTTIFYDALLNDSAKKERVDYVSSLGYGFGYFGGLLAFLLCLPLLFNNGLNKILALKLSFIITAIWWLVFSIPFFINTKQQHGIAKETNIIKNSFKRLILSFNEAKQNKKIFMFLLAYFFYIDGVSTIFKIASDFALKVGIETNYLLIILMISQIVAFPFTILFGLLSQKFKLKLLISFNIIIYLIITSIAIVLVLKASDVNFCKKLFLMLGILVGTSQGSIQALSRSYFSKIIPANQSGQFFGLYSIFAKFSAILGPAFVSLGLIFFKSYIFGLAMLIIMFIIGFILLNKADKLNA